MSSQIEPGRRPPFAWRDDGPELLERWVHRKARLARERSLQNEERRTRASLVAGALPRSAPTLKVAVQRPAQDDPGVELGCCEHECDISLLMGFCPAGGA